MREVRRSAGTVAGLALLVSALTGCGAYGKTLRQRELVVHFDPAATAEQHLAARDACTGIPNTSPEPMVSPATRVSRFTDVRFRIDNADHRDLARLTSCLSRQPGVRGVDIPERM